MSRHAQNQPRHQRRYVGLGLLCTLLIIFAALVTGLRSSGVARGTSEAVGYGVPSDTPVPPPTNTPVPPPPTDTLVPAPTPLPLATSTIAPAPTAAPTTTLPPVATVILPTASPTTAASPIASIAAVTVPISVTVSAMAVAQNQTETATVRTAPRVHLAYLVRYTGLDQRVTGTAQADRKGIASIHWGVVAGPHGGTRSTPAQLLVRVSEPHRSGEATVNFRIFPPLQLVIAAKILQLQGQSTAQVSVRLAATAAVTVTVSLPGLPQRTVTRQAKADPSHAASLTLPLGQVHRPTTVRITIFVHTADGVTEARSLMLPLTA